jgi:hypothetical protein
MGKTITLEDNSKYVLMTDWLRTTLNPVAPKYPKVGQFIMLKKPYFVWLEAATEYIVETVEEFEPAHNPDEDGRDIRLSFVGCPYKGLNGKAIRERI